MIQTTANAGFSRRSEAESSDVFTRAHSCRARQPPDSGNHQVLNTINPSVMIAAGCSQKQSSVVCVSILE
jgi:hypothetical protein